MKNVLQIVASFVFGRVLIARGRDAADVAIATTFGANTLESFTVWTDEIAESATHHKHRVGWQ